MTTTLHPNSSELRALRELSLGDVRYPADMLFTAPETYASLLERGWIVRACDEKYGAQGYQITKEGKSLFSPVGMSRGAC